MRITIPTFSDLKFTPHVKGYLSGSYYFQHNKYTISVIGGEDYYSLPRKNSKDPAFYESFEVAILDSHGEFVSHLFDSGDFTGEVVGYMERERISQLMKKIFAKPWTGTKKKTNKPKNSEV